MRYSNRLRASVIIPVYNSGCYLEECLQSLTSKKTEEYEIVCVNDGSSDYVTLEILGKYRNSFRIIDLNHTVGAAAARNIGLKNALGEYVVFLDSDDYFEPNIVEIMLSCIDATEADVCVCGHHRISTETEEKTTKMPRILSRNICYLNSISQLADDALSQFPIATWAYMVRRRLLIDNDIEFQTLCVNNDVYYVIAVLLHAKGIVIYDKRPLVFHHIGIPTQLSSKYDLWTVPNAMLYTVLHERLQFDSDNFYKVLHLWLTNIKRGMQNSRNPYMVKQTYTFLREFLLRNTLGRAFSDNEGNQVLGFVLANPYVDIVEDETPQR